MQSWIPTLLAFSLLGSLQGQTSYVDFNPIVVGDLSGTANWPTYGNVDYNVVFDANSDGIQTSTGDQTPEVSAVQGNLAPFGASLDSGLLLYSGRIDDTMRTDVGYMLSFTFDDTMGGDVFPAESVFYLSDIDNTSTFVTVSAYLNGNPVTTSTWFSQSLQTSSTNTGQPATWDPSTQTLNGVESGELWVHQFASPAGVQFDELRFDVEARNPNDRIVYGLGNVLIVPEPASALLGGVAFLTFALRRKRSRKN